MQERGKGILFTPKTRRKNNSSEKNIFIHSYNSEKKRSNLKLFYLWCTYLYAHTSAFKTQQTTILENWRTLSYIKQLPLFVWLCWKYVSMHICMFVAP